MHIDFLPLLADPKTGESLDLRISVQQAGRVLTGELRSSTSVYPIVRGIPRFVPFKSLHQSRSFGYQWNRWPRVQFDSENVGRPMQGHTGRMFERITGNTAGMTDANLEGQLVLDLGCGPGRFVEIARRKGARVMAIDHSAAVEAAQRNFSEDDQVCICQGDALALPLKSNSMDGVYSIGVLHHTPDPAQGVMEAARVLRSAARSGSTTDSGSPAHAGGWLALNVYSQGGYYDLPNVQFWRHLFQRIWPLTGHIPPLVYSYAAVYGLGPLAAIPKVGKTLRKMARVAFPFVSLPDVRWSVLDTFDSVTPSYQSAHTPHQIFEWMKAAGLSEIEPSPWGMTAFHARKFPAAPPATPRYDVPSQTPAEMPASAADVAGVAEHASAT
jgi:ubiquinone/menaquinone biosynthesis C-methylase UbiE